jgi:hypothetical protein
MIEPRIRLDIGGGDRPPRRERLDDVAGQILRACIKNRG